MKITELQAALEAIKQEYGDVPIMVFRGSILSIALCPIQEVKTLVYPGNDREDITQFYFAALCIEV